MYDLRTLARLNGRYKTPRRPQAVKGLFREIAPDYNPLGDPWGHAMGAFFDVAFETFNRGLPVPAEWNFRPGISTEIEDDDVAALLAATSDDDLARLGRFLYRLTGRIDRAGLSY